MAKEVYYFSHDSNARHDPKCSALIGEFGAEAYGIFWMVIEILSEQENYKLKKFNKLYEGLARQLWIDADRLRTIIEAMLHEYELLVQDADYIWSDSLLRRMDIKEEKRQKKIDAGRKGGKNSGTSRKIKADSKQNEAPLQKNEANEAKESKVNKKESSNANIAATSDYKILEDEFLKLHAKGENDIKNDECLAMLDVVRIGIPIPFIVDTMKQMLADKKLRGEKVNSFVYYVDAIKERFNKPKERVEKMDPQIATRHREIAFNRWIDKGGKPDEFIYNAPTGT